MENNYIDLMKEHIEFAEYVLGIFGAKSYKELKEANDSMNKVIAEMLITKHSYGLVNKVKYNTLGLCALDDFINEITYIEYDRKFGFYGIANNRFFNISKTGGFINKSKAKKRDGRNHKQIMISSKKGILSRISIETLYAVMNEIKEGKVRNTYLNLRGNCKANEVVYNQPISDIEIVSNSQNLDHGRIWHKIYKDCGLVVDFSATDKDFKEYIRASQFDITEKYLLNYSDGIIEEVKDGWIDYRVTPSSDNGV